MTDKPAPKYLYLGPPNGPLPNLERREIVRMLYVSGLSVREIGIQTGRTHQAVHSMLQRMGIPLRKRGGNTGSHSRHRK
jgi:IS30 family transposase